ncbi:hypothetical protein VNO78_20072 [Psophocarpus tetragonolobus]|uniref:Uncharacterized protein n=1 Tax=Psophocarpus tetragonolobus TaxID=3891 RepID=A0AAN9SAM9_PSOTE
MSFVKSKDNCDVLWGRTSNDKNVLCILDYAPKNDSDVSIYIEQKICEVIEFAVGSINDSVEDDCGAKGVFVGGGAHDDVAVEGVFVGFVGKKMHKMMETISTYL